MNQEYVKKWLKEFNHDRKWLAEKCGAAPQTINNWLSTERGIPKKAVLIIEQLIEADRLRSTQGLKITQSLTLEFSSQDFDMIEEAAHQTGKKIRIWATDSLRAMAQHDINEIAKEIHERGLLAAEDPAPYNGKKANDEDKPA